MSLLPLLVVLMRHERCVLYIPHSGWSCILCITTVESVKHVHSPMLHSHDTFTETLFSMRMRLTVAANARHMLQPSSC